jgi:hypothetical protein
MPITKCCREVKERSTSSEGRGRQINPDESTAAEQNLSERGSSIVATDGEELGQDRCASYDSYKQGRGGHMTTPELSSINCASTLEESRR